MRPGAPVVSCGVEAVYFESAQGFRGWLAEHHASATELWVGFYKAGSGRRNMTWPESVDQALCHGWIDGIRKRVDDDRFVIRFTPRKRGSIWSAVNVKRMGELIQQGCVHPAGLAVFEARDHTRTDQYSYEQRRAGLDADSEAQLKANERAWAFWRAQPPSYRRTAGWWVISAKREETRRSRLASLIADCAAGRKLKQMSYGQEK